MCIAIYKPSGVSISEERLEMAFKANPDGWGLTFSRKDKIWYNKKCTDFDDFYEYAHHIKEAWNIRDFLIHFRTASSGKISVDNCHPLFVNENLAFVQNGNLYQYSHYFPGREKTDKTDVQLFNEELLQKLPSNFLRIPEIREALERYNRTNMSKMIFMDNTGRIDIINEQAGEWQNGTYYSNGGIENYIGYGYSGACYYRVNDVRHKGGLISAQTFSPEVRKNWKPCPSCKGWFPKEKLMFDECNDCRMWKGVLKYVKN